MEHPQVDSRARNEKFTAEQRTTGVANTLSGDCGKELRPSVAARWQDCGLEEKIERVRYELMQLRQLARSAFGQAMEANRLAHDHSHGIDGRIYVPAGSGRITGAEGSAKLFDPLA